jgi:2-oxo-4-hydroxy-4-carboxy-5-ureidoimidazoline decarboxylase
MTIHELNILPEEELKQALTNCCGSSSWVNKMLTVFPIDDLVELLEDAEEKWYECTEADWLEAFTHHPKIGDIESLQKKFASTATWAAGEQSGANAASQQVLLNLAKGNDDYEQKFGFIFIVCATGKSAEQMLQLLQQRLPNNKEDELKIAMDEQNKITKLRLEKLLLN